MRAVPCFLLMALCLLAQSKLDKGIQAEYQEVMALAAAPADGSTLEESAAKTRAESFKASLKAFLVRWEPRAGQLTTGRFTLARALAVGGMPKRAIPVFEAFIRDYPKSENIEEARLSLGASYLDSGQAAQAASTFEAFLRDRPKSDRRHVAAYYLGLARYQLGQIDAALLLIKSVVDSGLEDSLVVDANVKYVELLRDAGRVEAAREHLARLIAQVSDAKYLLALREQLDMIGKEAPKLQTVTT